MSQCVGTNPNRAGGKAPVDGPWLDGNHSHSANKTWYCFGKMGDMVRPGPSSTFVLVDEAIESLNDAAFATVGPNAPPLYKMIDWPGTYHNMGAGFAFADGHSEIKKWKDRRTKLGRDNSAQMQPGNDDIWWMSKKTTAKITGPDF
jgi:hypothetical protein